MKNPKSLRSIRVNFFQRDGAYWIALVLKTDEGEHTMMTECDAQQIQFNFEDDDIEKKDLN